MATRGAKPKPAHLRLVDGTHRNTRHGKKEEVAAAVEATNSIFGALHRPSYLKGEARKAWDRYIARSEEHTSELQSLMRISYAVFCLKKKNIIHILQQLKS